MLNVVSRANTSNGYMSRWLCRCGCGRMKEVRINHLRGGQTKSCGCRSSRNRHGSGHASWTGHEEMTGSFLSQWRQGAKSRGLEIEITTKELWELFVAQGRMCALTGLPIVFRVRFEKRGTASIDRIDSTRGYVRGNVQFVHRDINRMKLEYAQDYFINMCRLVAERNK